MVGGTEKTRLMLVLQAACLEFEVAICGTGERCKFSFSCNEPAIFGVASFLVEKDEASEDERIVMGGIEYA